MKTYCPECDRMMDAEVKQFKEKHIVKGEEFTQIDNVVVCKKCGEKIFHQEYDQDNIVRVYNKYRKKYGLMLPSEIKALREHYGISQKKFAQILGFGEVTITRYENGMIQDEVHNNTLELVKDESNFIKLLKKSRLSDDEKNKILSNLECKDSVVTNLKEAQNETSSYKFKDKYSLQNIIKEFDGKEFIKRHSDNVRLSGSSSCEFNTKELKEGVV